MRAPLILALAVAYGSSAPSSFAQNAEAPRRNLPAAAPGWRIELAAEATAIAYPTAVVAAPDGTVYVGSDPMDMTGRPTEPIDRVLAIRNGKTTIFADGLFSVKGLAWVDGALIVVHAPFISEFRDRDGDGKAESRVDLATGIGPAIPAFDGINDHIAGGVRLGMDGYVYVAIGDKGIPRGTGRDRATIRLHGGGVIRIRPDGTGLEVVSTGEHNPLSVALSMSDDIFTYGRADVTKKWQNGLTHHFTGAHFGYPYQFLTSPSRALRTMAAQPGGIAAQGVCYNEDRLPAEYRGNLFFCDWGLQSVLRFAIRKTGATFAVEQRSPLVTAGEARTFRPFGLATAADGDGFWLTDRAHDSFVANGPVAGRLYRLRYSGPNAAEPTPRPVGGDVGTQIKTLDHPALSVRIQAQRALAREGPAVAERLVARLNSSESETGRIHALWALDAIGGDKARAAIRSVLSDPSARVRLQAARSAGIRADRLALEATSRLLRDRDAAVRREASIALGKIGDPAAASPLYAALDEPDAFVAWSIRHAIRRLQAWEKPLLLAAMHDERRLEPALGLTDQVWDLRVVTTLVEALSQMPTAAVRGRIVANLAGFYRRYPEWAGAWFGPAPLEGPFPHPTEDWFLEGMYKVLDGLTTGLADRDSSVRFQAIVSLGAVGPGALPGLRDALPKEADSGNQALLIETLSNLGDGASAPILAAIVADPKREEPVRAAAVAALARYRDRRSASARLALIYDASAPPALVARALPDLARLGLLPPNEIGSFLESPAPVVRAAALLSLNVKKHLPGEIERAVLDRLDDASPDVRQAAMLAAVPLDLRPAIPRLIKIAGDLRAPDRVAAIEALCRLPDPRALAVYLAAIDDDNPRLRRLGEAALLAVRDRAREGLTAAAGSGKLSARGARTIQGVLADFEPIAFWRVIGPFPRVIPPLFADDSIDFDHSVIGALGRPVAWRSRRASLDTGIVALDDLARVATEQGGLAGSWGFDSNHSPSLGAFAFTELVAEADQHAILLVSSTGTLQVTLNGRPVHDSANTLSSEPWDGSAMIPIDLARGKNRLQVFCRQAMTSWWFSAQVARVSGEK
jgi:HEAT repeat protein/glucose/arabinose dehydrogenase